VKVTVKWLIAFENLTDAEPIGAVARCSQAIGALWLALGVHVDYYSQAGRCSAVSRDIRRCPVAVTRNENSFPPAGRQRAVGWPSAGSLSWPLSQRVRGRSL
jgi:hypothetical protein